MITPKEPSASATNANELLASLAGGAQKVLTNAAELRAEAQLLHSAGASSRALLLYQVSVEECAKIEMMGARAVSVLMNQSVDLKRFMRAFASHKAKNFTNAYMLPLDSKEVAAREGGKWEEASAAFKDLQSSFHQESNSAKNAALYVDFRDGHFLAPKERITTAMVERIEETNEHLLIIAAQKTKMLQMWGRNPDAIRRLFDGFAEELGNLRDLPNGPEEALRILMDKFLARADASGYREAVVREEGERASGE